MRNLCTTGAMALVFSFIFANAAFCQSPTFDWGLHFGGSMPTDATLITTDMAGNIYTAGSFGQRADFDASADTFFMNSSNISTGRSNFLCKYSADGRFLWAKKTDLAIHSIAYANGHIYIGGTFTGRHDMDFGADSLIVMTDSLDYNLYVSKLDTAANLVWNRVIAGTGYESLGNLSAAPNGDIYFCSYFNQSGRLDINPSADSSFIDATQGENAYLKFNANGDFLWGHNLPWSCRLDAVKTNGEYTYLGIFLMDTLMFNGQIIAPMPNRAAAAIAKINNNTGIVEWVKSFGAASVVGDLVIDNQNAVLLSFIAVNTGAPIDYDPSSQVFNLSNIGAFEITKTKFDSQGNFIKAVNFQGFLNTRSWNTYVDFENNFYIGGVLTIGDSMDFDLSTSGQNYRRAAYSTSTYIAKYDERDSLLWVEVSDDCLMSMRQMTVDNRGHILAAGYLSALSCDIDITADTVLAGGGVNAFIFKLLQPDFVAVQRVLAVENVRIWPNPAGDLVNIENAALGSQLTIIDALGRQLSRQQLNSELSQIATHDLSNGVYFFHFQAASGATNCQKVLIQR